MSKKYINSTDQEVRMLVFELMRQEQDKFVWLQQHGRSEREQYRCLHRIDILEQAYERLGKLIH